MHGLMMNMPLQISSLIRHAERYHGDTEIVSRMVEGGIHRYTYRDAHRRARQLANALGALGVRATDRIGTLAWNGFRHFEIYYATSGSGAICHTINPRLFPEQIAYIVNHAQDQYVFFDLTFLKLVEGIAPHCKGVRGWVAMTDKAHMPQASSLELLCYEDLVNSHSDDYVSGPSSTRRRPRRCATRRARPATPRACSTRIARPSCTPMPPACPTP